MPELFTTRVVGQRQVADDHFELIMEAHAAFDRARPGQFVNVLTRDTQSFDPLLRRPFSLYRRLPNGNSSLLYRVVGRGTVFLSTLQPGDNVSIIGPLGTGFTAFPDMKRPALVGGGVGIPPLFYWAQQGLVTEYTVQAMLGFATKRFVYSTDEFATMGITPRVATDDGTEGHHGVVTDLLREALEKNDVDAVYACGPRPMLDAVARLVIEHNIPAQFSFEEVMGCGVGACLSCVLPIHTEEGVTYQRVCKEGPVFSVEEVVADA